MLLLIIYIFMVDNKTGLDLFLFILNILFNKNKCLNVTIACMGQSYNSFKTRIKDLNKI